MSEEKPSAEAEAPKASGPKASKLPLILLGVNFLVILIAMGVLVQTRLLYKRPVITEESERKRLAALAAASPKPAVEIGMVAFEPVTLNLVPSPNGRKHNALIGFSLEIRDKSRQTDVETVRALIMDRFLAIVARKQPQELNNVQGRFILRTELLEAANKVIFENAGRIKAAPAPAAAAPAGGEHGGGGEHGSGEGHGAPAEGHGGGEAHGGGGEGHGGGHGAPAEANSHEPKKPIKDLVSNVYFSQFIVQ